jgi:D-lactate dehydrogenase (cytochrome)
MPGAVARTRRARGLPRAPDLLTGERLAGRLFDAAHTPGGHSPVLARPTNEAELAWVLRHAPQALPIGAQTSLTGGATPFGAWLLSSEHFSDIELLASRARVRVGAGVTLLVLEQALRERGYSYPPAPTHRGATVGGCAATNAAGAATFKYGTTRAWVQALSVMLACGEVLDLERGACQASPSGCFEIRTEDHGVLSIPVPSYHVPAVPKCSAGYHTGEPLDLVDLFVGSEGTLGVITALELRIVPAPVTLQAWLLLDDERASLALTAELRRAAQATWASGDARGLDVAAIEWLDARSLALLHADGRAHDLRLGSEVHGREALWVQVELPAGSHAQQALEDLASADQAQADGPLARFAHLVQAHGADTHLELALPGDARHMALFAARREAVPEAVNRRIALARQRSGTDVCKVAADMCVPFDALPAMLHAYRAAFERRGLAYAIWGHVSDGNVHANVLPRDAAETAAGRQALLELGDEVVRRNGCPLAEHGVGRDPVKQALLGRLYGAVGLEQMWAVKTVLDPRGLLAPGVLFPGAAGMPGDAGT